MPTKELESTDARYNKGLMQAKVFVCHLERVLFYRVV